VPDGTEAQEGEAGSRAPVDVLRGRVEVIKRGAAAISEAHFETLMSLVSEDFELHPAVAGAFMGATIYRGSDGIRRYLLDMVEIFEDFQFQPLAFKAWHDYIVCSSKATGYGRASGVEIDLDMIAAWRFRDDKIAWGGTFFSLPDALDAIGASEDELEPIE
jgi:ketosteroid isomerase-like protein